jgi:hypothetical protein
MTPEDITIATTEIFGKELERPDPNSWQLQTENFPVLFLLSSDRSWLRVLIPIVPVKEAEALLGQILAANFDETQACRYGIHQDAVWGVFQHRLTTLTREDFAHNITTLLDLALQGLSPFFERQIEGRIRQVIKASKIQGQSLESTMQTLDRFYAEGIMGEMDESSQTREATMAAWRSQLERLWSQVEP